MATIDGARGLGLGAAIGSLETGKRADVVRFHGHGPGLANIHDPYQQLVYCTSPLDVADVWVDGRPRVRDGRLVGADLGSLIDDSRPLAAELVTRAGMQDLSCLARSS
jgi:cytosine/adenosine deaminase-related metal-dependent hydrolase